MIEAINELRVVLHCWARSFFVSHCKSSFEVALTLSLDGWGSFQKLIQKTLHRFYSIFPWHHKNTTSLRFWRERDSVKMAVNTIFQNSGFLITFLSVCLNILACGKLINRYFSKLNLRWIALLLFRFLTKNVHLSKPLKKKYPLFTF